MSTDRDVLLILLFIFVTVAVGWWAGLLPSMAF